jgi:ABC-type antimicrobial peptide transport system permease subunit
MALGATRGHIAWPTLRETMMLAVFGMAIGVPAALALTWVIQSQLYNISPTDLTTIVGACILSIAVPILAAWIPVRRASKIDPLVALRCE